VAPRDELAPAAPKPSNPVIAAHYARKRRAGKGKMSALSHCIRKALGLLASSSKSGQQSES
jgi:hypothetical protein